MINENKDVKAIISEDANVSDQEPTSAISSASLNALSNNSTYELMDDKWYKATLHKIAKACVERNKVFSHWQQSISMGGPRAKLRQQFNYSPRKYTIGWNQGLYLVGIEGKDREFVIDKDNPESTVQKILDYIMYI